MFDHIKTYPLETPALRALDIVPVRTPKGDLIMVQDPLGLIEGGALLMPDPLLLTFLQLADGKTTLGEMAQRVTMATGQILPAGLFESIAQQLDEAHMLLTDRFVAALRAKYQEFLDSPVRKHRSFRTPDGDRLKMLKDLGDEFRRHKMSSLSPPSRMELPPASVVGVLSPHIDYQRGGPAYAWSYEALRQCGTRARTFIILGTSHQPTQHRFMATRKHFDTPVGQIDTDGALLDELAEAYGHELFADEFLHADEHTIELNATYLRQTFQGEDIRIVPILVGSFEDLLHEDAKPDDDPEIPAFISALRTVLEKHGDSVALIGGVDFSHCGQQFGDPEPNDAARAKDVETGDRSALDAVAAMDADAFFEHFRPDLNARKVCSIGTVYAVMKALEGRVDARVLSYQQHNSTDKTCLVTFASVAFVKKGAEQKPVSKIILL